MPSFQITDTTRNQIRTNNKKPRFTWAYLFADRTEDAGYLIMGVCDGVTTSEPGQRAPAKAMAARQRHRRRVGQLTNPAYQQIQRCRLHSNNLI